MGTRLEVTRAVEYVSTTATQPFLQTVAGVDVLPDHVPGSPNDKRWVRELTFEECSCLGSARTGDRLADGSVLLWLEDATRMGLEGLREWVFDLVCRTGTPIALGGMGFPRRPRVASEVVGR